MKFAIAFIIAICVLDAFADSYLPLNVTDKVIGNGPNDPNKEKETTEWKIYKRMHKKKFHSTVEELIHKTRFLTRADKIKQHNEKYRRGEVTYMRTLNKFTDMDLKEFIAKYNGFRPDLVEPNTAKREKKNKFFRKNVPSAVDWRQRGVETPVKDQDTCASCWSFAAAAAIESHEYIQTGRKIELSEQNLIDCAESNYNVGCMGGHMIRAFNYTRENEGLSLRMYYPYENGKGECRYKPVFNAGTYSIGYKRLPKGDEDALKEAVATVGPVSVGISANLASMVEYAGGIYYDENCSSTDITHAVLVVGYGTENGQDYWIIKNTLGKYWGENGYLRLARNKDNHCGVATDGVYPIVQSPTGHRIQ